MKKSVSKALSVFLAALMIVTSWAVVSPDMLFANAASITIGNNTQTHVVSNYQTANSGYVSAYMSGMAIPLDGTNGNPDMVIPGLNSTDDMVPQGLALYKEKNWVFVTSYIGSNSSHSNTTSVLYAVDFTTGEYAAKFNLHKKDGSVFTSHAGGIAISDNNLYICDSGTKLSYIPLSAFDDVAPGSEKDISFAGTCDLQSAINNTGTSYLSMEDGILWTGNFYESTSESYNTAANSSYNSLILGYDLGGYSDSEAEWNALVSLSDSGSKTPSYVIACPNEISDIQSLIVKDNNIYIGTSWGRKNDSHLYTGRVDLGKNGTISLTLENSGKAVKAYAITNVKSYTHLPMTEGMFFYTDVSGKNWIYNGFESAAYLYYGYSSSVCPKPTDVIWKIDADALCEESFSDIVTNEPDQADSGLAFEVVATENNEPVTRVMRSTSGDIGTVYYADENASGTLTTKDSYNLQNFVLLKATNHSNNDITITKIEAPNANFKIGNGAAATGSSNTLSPSKVIAAGETAYFKVTGTTSMGTMSGDAFTATYKMSGITAKGTTGTYTAKAYMRIVGNLENSETFYNKNKAYPILAMMGWNTKGTHATPVVNTTVTYKSPADISRTMDLDSSKTKNYINTKFYTYKNNELTLTVKPANSDSDRTAYKDYIDSSGDTKNFTTTYSNPTIYYNINAAKFTNLKDANIKWSFGAGDNESGQYIVYNSWSPSAIGTLDSSSKQYPGLITDDTMPTSGSPTGSTNITTTFKDTTLSRTTSINSNGGMIEATNEIRAWGEASRTATKVFAKITVKLNTYNASDLATLVHKCENTAFVSERYNATLWNDYQTALSDAINKVGAYAQTQEVINSSYTALENAYNALLSKNASTYAAEIYKISHKLYTGKSVSGEPDKTFNEYYLAASGESFTPAYITDTELNGYTLSLANKIDARNGASQITAAITANGSDTVTYNYFANEYTVKFVNADDTVLQSENLFYGSVPAYNGETPLKGADNSNHYAFNEWSPEISAVTDDTTYTATFSSEAHNNEWIIDKIETCKDTGLKHNKCTVCGAVTNENTVIPVNDSHSYTAQTVSAEAMKSEADCNNAAVYYYSCSVCGKVEKDDAHTFTNGTANGHDFEWVIDKYETCKETGLKHQKCKNCDAVQKENTEIDVNDNHSYTAQTVSAEAMKSEADCNNPAVYYYSCSVCGKVEKDDAHTFTNGTANGHSFVWVTDKEATCGADGVKHEKCENCTETRSLNTPIDATGEHTGGSATCRVQAVCDVCGKSYGSLNANNHANIVDTEAVSPTCGNSGLGVGTKCADCDTVIDKPAVIPVTGAHTGGEATCKVQAACAVCGTLYGELNSGNHKNVVTIEGKDAICGTAGLTEGKKCADCDTILVEQQEISPIGKHTGGKATCHEKAVCEVCGEHYGQLDPTNHTDFVVIHSCAATCTDIGLTEGLACAHCDKVIKKPTQIPALGHTDTDNDSVCDACGETIEHEDKEVYCGCICHDAQKSSFYNFFYKIFKFFWKLFSINESCECGTVHY